MKIVLVFFPFRKLFVVPLSLLQLHLPLPLLSLVLTLQPSLLHLFKLEPLLVPLGSLNSIDLAIVRTTETLFLQFLVPSAEREYDLEIQLN